MTSAELREVIDSLAGLPYGGEVVDQKTHALQTAALARADGADSELVLAALLHDVGRAVHPELDHEEAGEKFGHDLLGTRVGWLIGRHAQAKRCLVATDASYLALLSPASVGSLQKQGGPMSAAEVESFLAHPWAQDALRLRRWDDMAKDPDRETPDLDVFLDLYDSVRR